MASRGRAPETRATALAEKRYDDGKLLLVRVADGATLSERLNVGIAAAAEQRRPYVALLGRDASFSRWVASPPPPTQTPTHPPTTTCGLPAPGFATFWATNWHWCVMQVV